MSWMHARLSFCFSLGFSPNRAGPLNFINTGLRPPTATKSIRHNMKLAFVQVLVVAFLLAYAAALPIMQGSPHDPSRFAKRRGGSGGRGGGSSGGSSRGGSSSGSRGGSGSSGSRGGGSSGSRGSSTTSSRPMRGGYYYGGGASPYIAGAAAGAGIGLLAITAATAGSHMHGYWGNGKVYDYHYNTTLNSTDYQVDCYCIAYTPCSCAKPNSTQYFEELPEDRYKKQRLSNGTLHYDINGTLEKKEDDTSDRSSNSASSSSSYVLFWPSLVVAALSLL